MRIIISWERRESKRAFQNNNKTFFFGTIITFIHINWNKIINTFYFTIKIILITVFMKCHNKAPSNRFNLQVDCPRFDLKKEHNFWPSCRDFFILYNKMIPTKIWIDRHWKKCCQYCSYFLTTHAWAKKLLCLIDDMAPKIVFLHLLWFRMCHAIPVKKHKHLRLACHF